ncbi:MAG: hypothetical protein P4N59_09640 [Negativicutes bacterium]|nr:hypothetical protein [Negativicutes bacterium]
MEMLNNLLSPVFRYKKSSAIAQRLRKAPLAPGWLKGRRDLPKDPGSIGYVSQDVQLTVSFRQVGAGE